MKKQTKQQIVAESFLSVEEDPEVQELREKKEREEREARMLRELSERKKRYMFGGVCFAHDRVGCAQCTRAARGECPSAIEESCLPHDF
jgi:hypothetical protein